MIGCHRGHHKTLGSKNSGGAAHMTRAGDQQNVGNTQLLQQRPGVLGVLMGGSALRFLQQRGFGNADRFQLLRHQP